MTTAIAASLALVSTVAMAGTVVDGQVASPAPGSAAAASVEMQEAAIATAQQLRKRLKDSESARFRNVFFRTTIGADHLLHHAVCGEINAKNSYGGYGGWTMFFGDRTQLIIGDDAGLPASVVCDPARGTWLRNNDLSAVLAKMVTRP